VTTTGGPEQFIADPATSDERAGYPIVIGRDAERLPGDDIVVEPQSPEPPRRRNYRAVLLTAVVVGLAAGGIAGALVAYNRGGSDNGASKLSSTQPVQPPAVNRAPRIGGAVVVEPKPRIHPKPAKATASKPKTAPKVVTPPKTVTQQSQTPPPQTPATAPIAATPLTAPPSVLQWTSTPRSITIKAGAHIVFTVSVFNPTKRNVTLPQPLSCPPTSRGAQGAIGGTVCAQTTQVIKPHQHLRQKYTIFATTTADASGKPLPAGTYVASVENLFNVKVTVTKA
jgi:hypothetical protein